MDDDIRLLDDTQNTEYCCRKSHGGVPRRTRNKWGVYEEWSKYKFDSDLDEIRFGFDMASAEECFAEKELRESLDEVRSARYRYKKLCREAERLRKWLAKEEAKVHCGVEQPGSSSGS